MNAPEPNQRRKSPRQAIAAHCKSCIYDTAMPGTWRMQTEACTAKTCELFDFRPHSTRKRNEQAEQVHCHNSGLKNEGGAL